MNAKMADGTARCADHCDGMPEGMTADPCLYCGAVPTPAAPAAPAAPVEAAPAVRPCDYCHTDEHAGCPDCGTHPYMAGGRCTPCQAKFRKAEREAGMSVRERYGLYISDGIGDTDGYFAPLSFEAWAHSEGIAR